ncbi:telomere-protecting terminal protein Tpg [Streptomyces sp. NPDC054904]|jgi:transcriptional regulator with XRE-family HTH domain|uniref:telomere-protecting terminal protein Tpg n=1 Tax=Streptomyces sp. ASQP_92 TaxID=2979116 RepID=UPI0021BECD09|nr:helix-turn-helix transcriptional regulator [Streptomyces sp. ASQP_92]MCT9093863.1 helix-turn-helix domain-containing protein [Streptomyces sp. ASQP_92]
MGKLVDAMRARFQTRNAPKTARGQFNALMRKEKGNTAKVAERLGVSRRTVQRYVKGERNIAKSKPEILDRLQKEAVKDHQPRVTARAQKEAQRRGMTIETRASFGFTAGPDSTDDPRVRRLTEDVPDHLIPQVFDALRAGDEDELNRLLGQGLAEEYFRTPGTDAEQLDVEFKDIDYVELDLR